MTTLTDRYLGAALGGAQGAKRADMERELRSSIGDAIDGRVEAGEDRATAEVAVLEGLGDPAALGARLSGRPLWIVGPQLYLVWRRLLLLLLPVALGVVAVVQTVLAIARGETAGEVIIGTAGAVVMVGVQLTFWVTLVFAVWERVASAEDVRRDLGEATGRWTVDRLPARSAGLSASDLVGELLTGILSIVGLVVLAGITVSVDGASVPLLAADARSFWVPVLMAVLVAQVLLQVVVYARGRWTVGAATLNAVLGIAFAAPVILLCLRGQALDPAFGAAIGVPGLGDAGSPLMVVIAIGVLLVTCWEVIDGYRKARFAAPAA